MLTAGLTFFLQALCSISETICLPQWHGVVPEPSTAYADSLRGNVHAPASWNNRLPIIETRLGLVEGYHQFTIRNRSIFAFEGMRYAHPPVRELRFRAPAPIRTPWSGIQQATKLRSACLQMDGTQYFRVYGKEDCLFINVYTPTLPDRKEIEPAPSLPVLFFIHGGGHFFGTSGLYGPAYFLDTQNVLLVTFNYRLGVLGYLSTGDSAAPGNFALKDQALALRWVHENIAAFGGDPSRITLFGQSAGAATLGLHLTSPKTRSIPVNAIMHSGDPFCHWGLVNRTFESTRDIAKKFYCPTRNSHQLVNCLRQINGNTLVAKQLQLFKRFVFPIFAFGPVVEHSHPDAFLVESPEVAYSKGHVSRVPVLKGFVPNEGDFLAAISYLLQIDLAINREFDSSFPLALELQRQTPAEIERVRQGIDAEYLHGEPLTFWTRNKISDFLGDRYVLNGIRKGLEIHSKFATTYGFVVDYKGRHSSLEALGLSPNDWGVSHVDDLQYLLNSTLYFKALRTSDSDFKFSEFLINVWGNFIQKGKPVFTNEAGEEVEFWKPVDPHAKVPNIMRLCNALEKSPMIEFPFERRYQLWKSFGLRDDKPVVLPTESEPEIEIQDEDADPIVHGRVGEPKPNVQIEIDVRSNRGGQKN